MDGGRHSMASRVEKRLTPDSLAKHAIHVAVAGLLNG